MRRLTWRPWDRLCRPADTTCARRASEKNNPPLYKRRRCVFEFPARNCDETIVGWAQLTLELQSSIIMREWIVSTAVVCQKRIGNKIMHERYIEKENQYSFEIIQNYCNSFNNDKSNYSFELIGSLLRIIFAIIFSPDFFSSLLQSFLFVTCGLRLIFSLFSVLYNNDNAYKRDALNPAWRGLHRSKLPKCTDLSTGTLI